jgi:hypothetical protein
MTLVFFRFKLPRKYKAATKTRRVVWISDRFQQLHGAAYSIILASANLPGSKWQLIENKTVFLEKAKRLNRLGLKCVPVCLISQKEQARDKDYATTVLQAYSTIIRRLHSHFSHCEVHALKRR